MGKRKAKSKAKGKSGGVAGLRPPRPVGLNVSPRAGGAVGKPRDVLGAGEAVEAGRRFARLVFRKK